MLFNSIVSHFYQFPNSHFVNIDKMRTELTKWELLVIVFTCAYYRFEKYITKLMMCQWEETVIILINHPRLLDILSDGTNQL